MKGGSCGLEEVTSVSYLQAAQPYLSPWEGDGVSNLENYVQVHKG